MARIEGITIEIGSDLSGLNKAIKEANKEINSLSRELKGVDSLLKLDPGNVELLAQKEQLLGDAIQKTNDKLKGLQEAKEDADRTMAEGGQVNEDAYRNLQREIAATEQKLQSLEQEQKQFGSVAKQQLEATAKKFDELGGKIEGVGKKLTPLSGAAAGVVGGMGGLAVKAGKAADEINTLSKVTGISTEDLQKLKYGSELVDVSLEDVAGSMKKLKKNMATASSGTGSAADAFAKLNVNVTDADGNLRDSNEVFYEAIDALGKMENETERDALAMTIFGKSASNLNPLIEEGSDAFAEAAANAHIMSQAQLDAANEFNDVIDQTKATVGSALMALGATIGQILMPVLQKIGDFLTGLSDKLANMNPTILTVIMVIGSIVAAAAPLLIIIGKVISSVGTIISIIPTLTGAVSKLFAVVAANPIMLVIAGIAAVIAYLVHLYNSNEDFRQKVQIIFDKIKTAFGIVVEVVKIGIDKIKGFVTAVRDTVAGVAAVIVGIINTIKEKIASIVTAVSDMKQNIVNKISEFVTVGANIVKGLWEGIKGARDWILGKIKEWCGSILQGIKNFFGIKSPSTVMRDEVGEMLGEGVAEGIEESTPEAVEAMKLMERQMELQKKKMADAMKQQDMAKAMQAELDETQEVIDDYDFDLSAFDFDLEDLNFDFSEAMLDFGDAANLAVAASYQQSDELLNQIATATAQYIGQALLDGLVGIQDTILAAMPAKLQLNMNGRQLAETAWTDFDSVGNAKNRIFAPTRQTIANIATSVVNTYVTSGA